jgi:SAM-dependent methyltransferase
MVRRVSDLDVQNRPWQDLAFLVPPNQTADWRMVLLFDAAVDNGLLEALPGSATALAADLGLTAHAVRVVLDGLALWGIVRVDQAGTYALEPGAPDADATAVLRHHARAIRGWGNIVERVRAVPPDRHGITPARVEVMLDALAVMGRESAPGAVDACLALAPDAATVLDLGGGHGQFAVEFSRRGIRAVMQDKPEVVDLARRKGWLAGTEVDLFPGDFFEVLPDEPFDLVFCAGVVYTFDAERVLSLLTRARSVIAPGGHLAIHTFLRGTDELATLFSAQMLGGVAGGQSHGEDDFRRWFDQTGYRFETSRRLERRPEWLLVATPIP